MPCVCRVAPLYDFSTRIWKRIWSARGSSLNIRQKMVGLRVVSFQSNTFETFLCFFSQCIFLVISVHFRIREMDPTEARSLYPPVSGITYWQVEDAKSIVNGSSQSFLSGSAAQNCSSTSHVRGVRTHRHWHWSIPRQDQDVLYLTYEANVEFVQRRISSPWLQNCTFAFVRAVKFLTFRICGRACMKVARLCFLRETD